MRRIKTSIIGCIALLLLHVFAKGLVWAQMEEYDLKALFLERFSRFVDWPAESGISDPSTPFVIGVIGKSSVGSRIEEIYTTLKIKKKNIVVLNISSTDEIDACHLLFISGSTEQNLLEIIAYTKDKPILTVSDTKGYAEKGVYINFYVEKGRLRFEINESAVKESRLKMSYMLMQHARIIKPVKGHK